MEQVNIYLATLFHGVKRSDGYHMELLVAVGEDGEEVEQTARAGNRQEWKEPDTTRNRLAAVGLLQALRRLKRPCELHIYSDNKHIVSAVRNGWLRRWESEGFLQVKNADIWEPIAQECGSHIVNITFSDWHRHYDWQQFEMRKQEEEDKKTC